MASRHLAGSSLVAFQRVDCEYNNLRRSFQSQTHSSSTPLNIIGALPCGAGVGSLVVGGLHNGMSQKLKVTFGSVV